MLITYYVATSLDSFIAGENDDISGFRMEGSGVAYYQQDLQNFDHVIMGRRTYEFGYKYGMQPGQAPYPGMEHFIFSQSLKLENPATNLHTCPLDIDIVKELKAKPGKGIYLCGGGEFAGWLLEHGLIDVLKIKLNPFVQGKGIRLFGRSERQVQLELSEQLSFDHGLQILTYQVAYGS